MNQELIIQRNSKNRKQKLLKKEPQILIVCIYLHKNKILGFMGISQ